MPTAALRRIVLPIDPQQVRPATGLGEALHVAGPHPLRRRGLREFGEKGLDRPIRGGTQVSVEFCKAQVGIERIIPQTGTQGGERRLIPGLQRPLGAQKALGIGGAAQGGGPAAQAWDQRPQEQSECQTDGRGLEANHGATEHETLHPFASSPGLA